MADDWLTTGAGGYPMGYFGAGATGLAGAGDIWSFFQNLAAKEQQQKLFNRFSKPEEFAQYTNAFFKPMGDAENRAVQRDLGANWSVMTGGAPGGAMNQYISDALAKIESKRYMDAAGLSMQALQGAGGLIPGQQPAGGSLANVLKSLMALRQIGGQGANLSPGISAVPGMSDYRAGERADYATAPGDPFAASLVGADISGI